MILTMECVVCPFPHPNVSSRAPCILIPREVVQRSGETFQKELVSPAGFEPATHSLEGCCSVQLSYGERCGLARLVGARGFEPPTPCSQSRCATRLRYTPTLRAETKTEHALRQMRFRYTA